jgi:hypothetical protein
LDGEAAILWAETLDSIGAEECAAIIRSAELSGELNEHWSQLGWRGGLRAGSGELGAKRRQLAEYCALGAAIKTGALSIERMGTAAWAMTWQWDYKALAASAGAL